MTGDDGAIVDPSEPGRAEPRVAGLALSEFQAAARAHLIAARSAELPNRAAKPADFERELWWLHDAKRAGEIEEAQVWPALRPWFAQILASTEAGLATAAPDERWLWQIDVAIAHENLGDAAVFADDLVAASEWFARQCAALRAIADAHPEDHSLGDRLLRAYDKATHVALCLGRFEEAHGWLEHALATIEAAPRSLRWQQAAWQRVYAMLGNVAVVLARASDAAAWFDCALDASRWLHDNDAWSRWDHELCVALVARAEVARDAKEAAPLLREARKRVGYHRDHHAASDEDRALLAERIDALWRVRG